MNLTNLLADLYRRLGFGTSPAAVVTTRLTALLNETQQEIFREPGMEYLLNDTITIASVASQPTYGLTPEVARIKTIREATNRIALTPMSLSEYRTRCPDTSNPTAISTRWVDLGFDGIDVEPSNASTLFVDSTNAGDTGTAYLEGFLTGGIPFSTSVTMTGVTAVSFTPTTIISVTKFYLSAVAVGTVTLVEDAEGGTVLATLGPGAGYSRIRRIALVPTPSSAITYTIDCERNLTDLVNGLDEPQLPTKFHSVLVLGARMKEYEKTESDSRYTKAKADYERGLRNLKFWLYQQAVGSPNLRGQAYVRRSTGTDHVVV